MLTAHLPSGCILARTVRRPEPYLLPAALIGSVLPDFDMLWFLIVDHGATHHHRYWPHIPLIWAGVAAITLLALWQNRYAFTAVVAFAAMFLHLAFDTIAGGTLWTNPWGDSFYSLVTIPATDDSWILSFVLHWTVLLEVAVWLAAVSLSVKGWSA